MKREPAISIAIADRQACLPLDRARLRRAVRAALKHASIAKARSGRKVGSTRILNVGSAAIAA